MKLDFTTFSIRTHSIIPVLYLNTTHNLYFFLISDNAGFSSVTFESRSTKDNVDLLKDAEPIHYDTIDTSQEFGISRWDSSPPKNLFDDV